MTQSYQWNGWNTLKELHTFPKLFEYLVNMYIYCIVEFMKL